MAIANGSYPEPADFMSPEGSRTAKGRLDWQKYLLLYFITSNLKRDEMQLKLHLFNRMLTEIFSMVPLLASQTGENWKHFKLKRKKQKKKNQQGDIYFISPPSKSLPFFPLIFHISLHVFLPFPPFPPSS